MPFNPFDKPIVSPLTGVDLDHLISQSVSEGYPVEFKRELPSAHKIAKSLASFANTHGGWFIVGVVTSEHNVAREIRGFDLNAVPDPISVIRDAARVGVDPPPFFFGQ